MAFTVTNHGMLTMLNSAFTSSTDIRMMVFKGTVPGVAAIRDMDFLSELLASSGLLEATASGYTRQALSGKAVTKSDTTDNVVISASAPVLTAVATGETWTGVGYYIEGASDAARVLLGVDVPTPPTLATNGADVTLPALSITVTGS